MACLLATASCRQEAASSGGDANSVSVRAGRFGSLRDFVLVRRASPPGTWLFVDRFEATQSDWAEFAATDAGKAAEADRVRVVGAGSLPVGGMDFWQARAFARWRCGRLPSEQEWQLVTEGGGRSPFPWGSKEDPTRANTGDLALGERMPVGTFESGRKAGGNAPYDLIGNVREWTETVPYEWCQLSEVGDPSSFRRSLRRARRQPALAVWADRFGALPGGMLVAVGGDGVPRRCVGADFETPMRDVWERQYDTQAAGERRVRTGLRVYTTVGELLARLVALPGQVTDLERAQLRSFARRGGNREALRAAYEASPLRGVQLPGGSAGQVLVEELLRQP
ncbi:MAG: SUMF1/EgtB/PvdO family nonheme iron enzyme [Planctomycetes bacterium]|nr:SUMF1/EgtB/PvdO family nonheme iron enzyme [Planctomycetota bacterium]